VLSEARSSKNRIVFISVIVILMLVILGAYYSGVGPFLLEGPRQTYTITPSTSISWDYQSLVSAIINSSEVKPDIANAYYYSVEREGAASPGNGTQLFAEFYVVGVQTVSGNWTTGYTVTYAGRQILNVTVQYTQPSTYNVTGMTVANLTDLSYQGGSYNTIQKQVIEVALANSTVRADIGGMAYYVDFADSQINGTGYWVQISQVNGYKILEVTVNSDLTEVLEVVTYTSYPRLG
jgi:hypothetical protein